MDLGPGELLIILVLVLLVFGPSRLPSLARSLGEAIRELRRGESGAAGGDAGDPAGTTRTDDE
ncbi:MAG: twin-arginine translocase TatA/TatE family subunit [Acidimicrobiales bacterium]